MTTTEVVETIAGTWQAPPWADSFDAYQGELDHVRMVEADDQISAFLSQEDTFQRDDDGQMTVMRAPVTVSVICPCRLTEDYLPQWDDFTIEQARGLTAADLPGIDLAAWPTVQGVVTDLLAIYDAAAADAIH